MDEQDRTIEATCSRSGAAARAWLRQRALAFLTVVAVAGLALGCGGDASADSGGDDGAAESAGRSRSRPEEPPGTDPEEVEPHVTELLNSYDEVVTQIVADPGVAGDPDDPLVQEFVGLFEPDSETVDATLEWWVEMSEAGTTVRPASDRLAINESRLDGPIETVSADEVRFPTCDAQSREVRNGDGEVTQRTLYREVAGEGVAVRVDGQWRLRQLDIVEGRECQDGAEQE